MATVIAELGEICRRVPSLQVTYDRADMLVTVMLGNGRQQTVKVWTQAKIGDPVPTLRLQSRAALVHSHKVVREALEYNRRLVGPGLALDVTVQPPALDVMYGMVADAEQIPVDEFLDALHRVATLADRIEAKTSGGGADRF